MSIKQKQIMKFANQLFEFENKLEKGYASNEEVNDFFTDACEVDWASLCGTKDAKKAIDAIDELEFARLRKNFATYREACKATMKLRHFLVKAAQQEDCSRELSDLERATCKKTASFADNLRATSLYGKCVRPKDAPEAYLAKLADEARKGKRSISFNSLLDEEGEGMCCLTPTDAKQLAEMLEALDLDVEIRVFEQDGAGAPWWARVVDAAW